MILDRRMILTAMAATPAVGLSAPATARTPDEVLQAALDRVFEAAAPVGLGATLISREGVVAAGVRGLRQKEGSEPVRITDAWHLGSNTKAMTAAVFARLVEQGRAAWDLKIVEALSGNHHTAWAETRVIDFMHHRAGLKDVVVMG